jgi:hypothetical protein
MAQKCSIVTHQSVINRTPSAREKSRQSAGRGRWRRWIADHYWQDASKMTHICAIYASLGIKRAAFTIHIAI